MQEIFTSLCLPEEVYDEFCDLLQEGPAIEQSNASLFTQSLFREFYSRTWYTVNGTSTWTQTHRGSRPGDSFADICFGFALAKLLRRREGVLLDKYPFLTIAWTGQNTPHPDEETTFLGPLLPVWADDLALAMSHDSPQELLQLLPQVANDVLHSLAVSGLQPNMKPGKTEVLVDLKGRGSLQARRDLMHQDYKFHLQSPLIAEPLRAVGSYRHLGTIIQLGGRTSRDVQTKFAIAHETVTRYKAQIFSNRQMNIGAKTQLFNSLVMSAIVFNAATWQTRTKGQQKQIVAGFDRLHKRIAVMHFGKQALEWSQAQVYSALQLPTTEVLLRVARLRYLAQIVRVGQPHLWLMEDWATNRMLPWKRLLRRAQARAIAYHRRVHEWEQWHKWTLDYLCEHAELQAPEELRTEEYFCLCCVRAFASPAALAVHAFKTHARRNVTRHFVDGLQCKECLKHFSTAINLQNHVKRSGSCLQTYLAGAFIVDPEPGVNSRTINQSKPVMPDPVLQGEGPKQDSHTLRHADPFVEGECRKLWARWTDTLTACEDKGPLLERLRKATLDTCLFPAEIRQNFADWRIAMTQSENLTLDVLGVFHLYETAFAFSWFVTGRREKVNCRSPSKMIAELAAKMQTQMFRCVRPPKYQPVVFAHLFSGHRRFSDVQECLERKGFSMISVDIIFNVTLGDLNRPETFALFKRAIEENVIQGIVAGPPCETWSRARGQPLPDGSSGPRVLRTNAKPFGKLDLSKREDEQVTFGTRLLAVAVKLLCVALAHGKTGVLEHPAGDDNEPHLVSIWKTAILRLLQLFPRVTKVRVLQGHYGGKTVKPTDLLLVNVTDRAEELFLQQRTTALPTATAIGKNHEGKWKTAVLKAYPPDFCEAIATLCAESQPQPDSPDPIPLWFKKVFDSLNASFDTQASMGEDFGNRGQRPSPNLT